MSGMERAHYSGKPKPTLVALISSHLRDRSTDERTQIRGVFYKKREIQLNN